MKEVFNQDRTHQEGLARLEETVQQARNGGVDLTLPVRETAIFVSIITQKNPDGELTRASRKAVRDDTKRQLEKRG